MNVGMCPSAAPCTSGCTGASQLTSLHFPSLPSLYCRDMDITTHWLVSLSVEASNERTVTRRSILQGDNFIPRISLVTIRTSPCAAGEDQSVSLSNEEAENHAPPLVHGARRLYSGRAGSRVTAARQPLPGASGHQK